MNASPEEIQAAKDGLNSAARKAYREVILAGQKLAPALIQAQKALAELGSAMDGLDPRFHLTQFGNKDPRRMDAAELRAVADYLSASHHHVDAAAYCMAADFVDELDGSPPSS